MPSPSREAQELIDKLLAGLQTVRFRLEKIFAKEIAKKVLKIRPIGFGLSHKLEIESISSKKDWAIKTILKLNHEIKLPVIVSQSKEKSIIVSIEQEKINLFSSLVSKSESGPPKRPFTPFHSSAQATKRK